MRKWFAKYDWGSFIEFGKILLVWAGIAMWIYFLWLVTEYYFFK